MAQSSVISVVRLTFKATAVSSMPAPYKPVSAGEEDAIDDAPEQVFTIDDDDESDSSQDQMPTNTSGPTHSPMDSMEIESANDDQDPSEMFDGLQSLFLWKDPWIPSLTISLGFVAPILIGNVVVLYDLTGRLWTTAPFCFHLFMAILIANHQVAEPSSLQAISRRFFTSLSSMFEIVLFGYVYQKIWEIIILQFFTEPDKTTVVEWAHQKKYFECFRGLGFTVVAIRLVIGSTSTVMRCTSKRSLATLVQRWSCLHYFCKPFIVCERLAGTGTRVKNSLVRTGLKRLLLLATLLATILFGASLYSLLLHFVSWPIPTSGYEGCDSLDETECFLPFPSQHFMVVDESTATGWRVNLQSHLLPRLRGNIALDLDYLNSKDGFSTMGPILFYLDGLKEAHEAGIGQLKGSRSIAESVSNASVTLLLDVDAQMLVAHSAEIDYLDILNPMVLVFPAQPLKHNNRYALAVVSAVDLNGDRLSPTPGMTLLLQNGTDERRYRYISETLPALERAAEWIGLSSDPTALQLLFDFHTASEESQLGAVRSVRDGTLSHVSSDDWVWKDHLRTNLIIENNCHDPRVKIARTVHGELDVPWFLAESGPGMRGAFLDENAVRLKEPVSIEAAKFVVHIPCSLKAAALGEEHSKPLRAVVDYGHGLFFSRSEASDGYLQDMADDQGYIVTAMDWRGMSAFDLLVVVKTLLADPSLFLAVIDNLIQGYGCKFAFQDFARSSMLSMDWFDFKYSNGQLATIPRFNGMEPEFVYYGNSQGAILGAGYVALSGPTDLIDRAALGVPGTPFALIMTRSLDFSTYDALLLLNFYDNRHVRFFLALAQMGWDSVEGSGVLAQPINEPFPPMLLQAGLGDVIVPSIAAEALARGLNATVLPNHPRTIYGLAEAPAASHSSDGSHVVLTELLYENEFINLPLDDLYPESNAIHVCLRRDPKLVAQLVEFINTGRVVNPCTEDECRRDQISC